LSLGVVGFVSRSGGGSVGRVDSRRRGGGLVVGDFIGHVIGWSIELLTIVATAPYGCERHDGHAHYETTSRSAAGRCWLGPRLIHDIPPEVTDAN
jgi:hypothetical protein